jgi:hypothetical protein
MTRMPNIANIVEQSCNKVGLSGSKSYHTKIARNGDVGFVENTGILQALSQPYTAVLRMLDNYNSFSFRRRKNDQM